MSSLKFCDTPYPQTILKYLFDMQQSNKMCDLVLKVGNDEIHVHKLVLSAVSPYFSALENTQFKENIENKIEFHDISKSALETIVLFIYTGEIEITMNNVYEIMSAANLFQISLLKLPVSHHLISSLETTNCLQILAYAELYDYHEVVAETLKFIAGYFHFVVTRDIFLQAPANIVEHVLCQRGLNLYNILNALGKWLKYNGSAIDFNSSGHITLKILERTTKLIIEKNPQFTDLLTSVLTFIKNYYCGVDKKLFHKDVNLKENQVILSIGGSSSGTIHATLESFCTAWLRSLPTCPHYDAISVIPAMKYPRMCFAVAQSSRCPDVVYVLGGLSTHSTGRAIDRCERYDVRTNTWTQLKEMPISVKCHAATWIDGKVVVTGGIGADEKAVNDVWEYLEKDDAWRAGVPLPHHRADHCSVNVMGTLYVLGGQGGEPARPLTTVERYNADLGTWCRVSDMPEPKYEFGCVAVNEFIYVIGGATKHYVLCSVHKYSTLTDKWQQCEDMPVPKSSFGCTVREGKIYCVGGSDIVHGPLCRVEMYNPQTNRWHYSSDQLKTSRAYSRAATVKMYIEK